eukprot:2718856-Amphidinium_carterae.2
MQTSLLVMCVRAKLGPETVGPALCCHAAPHIEGRCPHCRIQDTKTSQRKRVMVKSILNLGRAASLTSMRSAVEKWRIIRA